MGDMLPTDNKRKIDLAKEILIDRILPLINNSDNVGIRLFGNFMTQVYNLLEV
jgi:hypothetical protein